MKWHPSLGYKRGTILWNVIGEPPLSLRAAVSTNSRQAEGTPSRGFDAEAD